MQNRVMYNLLNTFERHDVHLRYVYSYMYYAFVFNERNIVFMKLYV